MKVLIVEDEVAAGQRLTKLIRDVRPSYQIVDQLGSVEAAVTFLDKENYPDLIFYGYSIGRWTKFFNIQ